MVNSDDVVRRINLIDILQDDDEECPPPPDNAAEDWTEEEIRAYFASGGATVPAPKPKAAVVPPTMVAMQCVVRGPVDKMQKCTVATPTPGAGEVLIKVFAAGVNFSDTLITSGRYNVNPDPPFTPGFEVAGEIAALGAGVSDWTVGQRVVSMPGWGGYAQYVTAKAQTLVEIPDNVNYTTAAAFPVAYTTSHIGLKEKARLQPGETLLVHGASGGVGLTAVELGAAMGATVIATASTPEKLAIAKSKGATHGIISSEQGMDRKVKELTNNVGCNVVYDPVGGELWEASMRAAAISARMLIVGFAGSKVQQIPANILLQKNIDAMGFYVGAYFSGETVPKAVIESYRDLMQMLSEGKIVPLISNEFPLEKTVEGIKIVAERKAKGKVVINVEH